MNIIPVRKIVKIIELSDYIIIRYHSLLGNKIAYKICNKEGITICSYTDYKSMYYALLLFRSLDNVFELR